MIFGQYIMALICRLGFPVISLSVLLLCVLFSVPKAAFAGCEEAHNALDGAHVELSALGNYAQANDAATFAKKQKLLKRAKTEIDKAENEMIDCEGSNDQYMLAVTATEYVGWISVETADTELITYQRLPQSDCRKLHLATEILALTLGWKAKFLTIDKVNVPDDFATSFIALQNEVAMVTDRLASRINVPQPHSADEAEAFRKVAAHTQEMASVQADDTCDK